MKKPLNMNILSTFTKKEANRWYFIIGVSFCFLISNSELTLSQDRQAVVPPPEVNSNATTQSSSEINIFRNLGSCRDNDEGTTRNRSHFPEDPEIFQSMPIPDPTKKPLKTSGDNPEVPKSYIIKEEEISSSEKAD